VMSYPITSLENLQQHVLFLAGGSVLDPDQITHRAMNLREWIDDRDGDASAVPHEEVLRHRLAEGLRAEESDPIDPEAIDEKGTLLDEPVDRKPLAKAVFDERETERYHVDLAEEEFRALTVVRGQDSEGWRSIAENGRIESVAHKIESSEDVATLNKSTEGI